jgi:hypothetical protein
MNDDARSTIDCLRLDVPTLSPHDVFEAAPGEIECLVYDHIRVLMTVSVRARARGRASRCIERWFVLDHHILTRQRQLDSEVEWSMPMPVGCLQHDAASDNSRMKRIEPLHTLADLLLER